jgi:hypothetical protein
MRIKHNEMKAIISTILSTQVEFEETIKARLSIWVVSILAAAEQWNKSHCKESDSETKEV